MKIQCLRYNLRSCCSEEGEIIYFYHHWPPLQPLPLPPLLRLGEEDLISFAGADLETG